MAQPKRLALLAYLAAATPRAFHSRDTLLALLWPDLNQEHARAALRQAIYVLRGALGDSILLTCGDVVIGLDYSRLSCDVVLFDRAIDTGDRAEAMTLYVGELLAGFHLSGAPEFERWLDDERVCLAARAAVAAWTLNSSLVSRFAGVETWGLECATSQLPRRLVDFTAQSNWRRRYENALRSLLGGN